MADNTKRKQLNKPMLIALVAVLLTGVCFFGYHTYQEYQKQEQERIAAEKAEKKRKKAIADTAELREEIDEYIDSWGVDESQITVCVRDIENDAIVYERNADQWMRAGSIYKLPLSMLWFDKIDAGEASLDDTIYYNRRKFFQEIGPLGNHQTGDILTYEEVIKTTILESDNTGGQILFQTYGGWNVYRKDALRYTDIDMGNRFMLQKNYMTARYTTDVSTYLYKHRKKYKLLIEWLRQAVPHQVLDTVIQVDMPQKFGTMELYKNGTGFVDAKHPYAISVFTLGMVDPASNRMGRINAMCYEYFNQ